MIVRGKDTKNPGKFAYKIYVESVIVEHVGGFDTARDADEAAEKAHRSWLFGKVDCNMTDDELLAELMGE